MTRIHDLAALAACIAALLAAGDAWARFGSAGPEVRHEALPGQDAVPAGSAGRIAIRFSMDKPWHVNSHTPRDPLLIPTVLSFAEADGIVIDRIVYPEHELLELAFASDLIAVYENIFVIGVEASPAADLAPGEYTLEATLRYQACDDKQCMPPRNMTFPVTLAVAAPEHEPAPANEETMAEVDWDAEPSEAPEEAESAAAEVAPGAPVLPTENWQALADRFETTGRFSYGNTREFLGFIDATERGEGLTDNYFAGRGFLWILGAILVGGFFLNLTPCVLPLIPINLAIIGAGARAGSKTRGFALGSAYGAGIAAVYGMLGLVVVLGLSTAFGAINASVWFNGGIALFFVVLGLAMFDVFNIDFSSWQAKLGLQGNQRGSFFVALGMGALSALLAGACVAPVLIATLLYAQDQYLSGNTVALLMPFLLGVGMAMPWPFSGAGLSFLPKPGPWMVRVKQILGIFIIGLGVYYGYTASVIAGERYLGGGQQVHAAGRGWTPSLEEGLERGLAENKPVIIDFWATWCKNCLVMDRTVLQNEEVIERLEDYVKVKYQAEEPEVSPHREVLGHYDILGLPAFVILEPKT